MHAARRAYQPVMSELNESHKKTTITSTQLMHWYELLCKMNAMKRMNEYLSI